LLKSQNPESTFVGCVSHLQTRGARHLLWSGVIHPHQSAFNRESEASEAPAEPCAFAHHLRGALVDQFEFDHQEILFAQNIDRQMAPVAFGGGCDVSINIQKG
jgi:hypothetical protein